MSGTKKPIVYVDNIKTRFADLDPYGHVNAPVYLDYIATSRWAFAERTLGVSSADLINKGLGFYLVNSNINYKRPIRGAVEVTVKSWVSKVEDSDLFVEFVIENSEGKVVSDGVLKFAVMDLKNGVKQCVPSWAESLFFES